MSSEIPIYSICNLMNTENLPQDCVVLDLHDFLERQEKSASPHRHSFFQVLLIKEGSGEHVIDFQSFPIAKGDLYFLSPGQIHKWDFDKATEGIIINFDEIFFSSFLAKRDYIKDFLFFIGNANYSLFKTKAVAKKVTAIFDKIYEEYSHLATNISWDLLRTYLLELFMICDKEMSQKEHEHYDSKPQFYLLKNFERLIEEHYIQKRLPKEYAEILCVTPNYLNALCQKIKGVSAGTLIRNRLLLESKRLLINSELSISEIAYQLDFKDNSYFSRFFKKYEGLTPVEFQKRKELNFLHK
ncbi:AraC family transcriptional regulator [Neptunitalea chrysea]|uniref:AraC family transcriptional regulator n=1 Tax=Neptunitalea chrysea TaxID=1647581 RepID=A0A9W6B7P1_9FLAO|nr:helix-turn-helix domain-containing protein [Neptunitalea chrysea]GLB52258.1 AraC family transcriptional regulator [Neptunitalea chrysea]